MDFRNVTVTEFTEALASKTSVPGGGGASGLVGAIAVALGDMVGEFTVGKKKYADVEDEIKALMEKAQTLRVSLLDCIEEDAVAFEPLSKAYSIPKDDPNRSQVMEECLRNAAAVPFKILELCCQAVDVLRGFADKGSVIMISDAATGAAMLEGAIRSAAINVRINTKSMEDRAYADELDSKVDTLVEEYTKKALDIYNDVMARL